LKLLQLAVAVVLVLELNHLTPTVATWVQL